MVWVNMHRKERREMINFQILAVQAPMGIGSNPEPWFFNM